MKKFFIEIKNLCNVYPKIFNKIIGFVGVLMFSSFGMFFLNNNNTLLVSCLIITVLLLIILCLMSFYDEKLMIDQINENSSTIYDGRDEFLELENTLQRERGKYSELLFRFQQLSKENDDLSEILSNSINKCDELIG